MKKVNKQIWSFCKSTTFAFLLIFAMALGSIPIVIAGNDAGAAFFNDENNFNSANLSQVVTEQNEVIAFMALEPVDVEPIEATPEPYTESMPGIVEVIFHGNGYIQGTAPESIMIQTPHDITASFSYYHMSKEGYEFNGWLHFETVQVIRPGQTATITGTGTVNLYAVWEPIYPDLFHLHNADTFDMGIQPLSTFGQFRITSPSEGQVVPRQNLNVTWIAVPGARYIISLRNQTTSSMVIERRDAGNTTIFTIQQSLLTAGHRYLVAMEARDTNNDYVRRVVEFVVEQAGGGPTPTPGPHPTPTPEPHPTSTPCPNPTPTPTPNPTLSLRPHVDLLTPHAQPTASGIYVTAVYTNQSGGWTATSNRSWLTVTNSGVSGDRLRVTVAENTESHERDAVITISAGTATLTIDVRQFGVPVITREYRVLTSEGGSLIGSTFNLGRAFRFVDNVKGYFLTEFNVSLVRRPSANFSTERLNQRPGCLSPGICTPFCGPITIHPDYTFTIEDPTGRLCRDHPHHRSGWHFLDAYHSSDIYTFRFVNFRICFHADGRGHREVNGLALRGHNNMIVSTARDDFDVQRTTSHEITHVLGAGCEDSRDCTPEQYCVMRTGGPFNMWCDQCRSEISVYLSRFN